MKVEFLKVIHNYNYSVSNTGLVGNDITGRTLKPTITNKGYHRVSLPLDGKYKNLPLWFPPAAYL